MSTEVASLLTPADIARDVSYSRRMTPRTRIPVTVTIDTELLEILDRIRDTQGAPISQQVDRALRLWLESIGALPKKRPAVARKRGGRA